MLIERLSIAPPGLDQFGWVTQGLGLTLIAAPQLSFVITSGVRSWSRDYRSPLRGSITLVGWPRAWV